MRRQRRSVMAAVTRIKLSVTRMGMGGIISDSPGEERRRAIAIEALPSQRLYGGNQGVVVRQQRVREAELVELPAPAGPQLREARVLLQEFAAVKVAAAVEKDLPGSAKAIDEIAAELVRR